MVTVRAGRPARELVDLFTLPADFDAAGVEAGTQIAELVHAAGAVTAVLCNLALRDIRGQRDASAVVVLFGGRSHQGEPDPAPRVLYETTLSDLLKRGSSKIHLVVPRPAASRRSPTRSSAAPRTGPS